MPTASTTAPANTVQETAAKEARDATGEQVRQQEELAQLRAKVAAQEKDDAEAALKRQIEEETRRKVEAERAEKQRVDREARQKAEAAEAKRKAEEQDPKIAESAELALRLGTADRQRAQVALTSLGFNTNGSDGVFGLHSREMISAWQEAMSYPITSFSRPSRTRRF